MLSGETEEKLAQIFITISLGEEKISKLKQEILTNFNINPIQFFFKLDVNNSNYLTKTDITNYLNSFSIIYTPKDIDFIFYFYDKDFDGVLNFYEFLDLVVSDSNYLYKKSFKKKYKHNKIDQSEINKEIDIDIQKSVLQIFIEEIELARQLNDMIIDIKQSNDFSLQDIFYEIKSYSYITNESIKAFFDRYEINYNDKFIKNIFIRFDNKEINGRISFNKFKNFFDLSYNKSINGNNNPINNNSFIQNQIPKIMNQTQISGDINLDNSQIRNINFGDKFNKIINNDNYINEEDIQFECSHLSRSGSVESKEQKDKNCGYILKNNKNKNNSYKNYLREKRSKSLEKSLSRSLSRKSEKFTKVENIHKKDIRNIRVIEDDNNNNNSINEGINMSNSGGSSFNEDISLKLPVRLDKNLVQRPLPRRLNSQRNKMMEYNFCYDNHIEDPYYNHLNYSHTHQCVNHFQDFNTDNNINENDKENIQYNHNYGLNNVVTSNNLDLKMFKEDNDRINNGRFEEY